MSWIGFWVLNTMYCVRKNAITIIKMPSGHTVFHCFHLKSLCILNLFPELHSFTLHNSLFSQRIYLDIAIRSKSYTCTDFTQVYLSCWAFLLNTNYHHHRKQGLLRLGESYSKNLIWLIIAASNFRVFGYVIHQYNRLWRKWNNNFKNEIQKYYKMNTYGII